MKIVKLLLLQLLLVGSFSAQSVLAKVAPAPPKYRQPLKVVIKDIKFNQTDHQLSVQMSVINNKEEFASNLTSEITLFKGDKLNGGDGYLFTGLNPVYNGISFDVPKIAPMGGSEVTVDYNVPASLVSGKYFIQVSLFDGESKFYGTATSEKSINITGTGNFIGGIKASVLSDGTEQKLMQGLPLKKDQKITVVISLKDNAKLKKLVNQGKVYLQPNILAVDNHTIKSLPRKLAVLKDNKISYVISPWEGLKTGPLTIDLKILNNKGETLASDVLARWFRNDRMARITKVKSGTNYYKKGDSVDVVAEGVFSAFPDGNKFSITSDILFTNGKNVEFIKQYSYSDNNSEYVEFDFSDQKVSSSGMVKSIKVSIKDIESNEIVDEYTLDLKQGEAYVKGVKKDNSIEPNQLQTEFVPQKMSTTKVIFLVLLGVVLIGIFGLFFYKYKKSSISIFAVIICGSFLFLLSGDIIHAQTSSSSNNNSSQVCSAGEGDCPGRRDLRENKIDMTFETYTVDDLGECPQEIKITGVMANMQCRGCLNGVAGNFGLEIQKVDGNGDTESEGSVCKDFLNVRQTHIFSDENLYERAKYNWGERAQFFKGRGPYDFSYKINNPGDYKYRLVSNTSDGCHCKAASWTSDWFNTSCHEKYSCLDSDSKPSGEPPTGGTACPDTTDNLTDNIKWSKVNSCDDATSKCAYTMEKAKCGSANENSYETKDDLGDADLCADNAAATFSQGNGWEWTCNKSGYDSSDLCSATKKCVPDYEYSCIDNSGTGSCVGNCGKTVIKSRTLVKTGLNECSKSTTLSQQEKKQHDDCTNLQVQCPPCEGNHTINESN